MAIARVGDVPPGEGRVIDIAGRSLALFNVDGTFHCIDNECPHRYGPLGEGDLCGEVVSCPWHGWEVNVVTGELIYSPGDFTETFACTMEGDEIVVDIGPR